MREAVELPLLRKDFIFHPYQIYEARAAGADCILLILAMLKEGELLSLAALTREVKMAALIEVHNPDEFALASRIGAELIGINNRDLHTFVTDLAVTEKSARRLSRRGADCCGKRDQRATRISGVSMLPARERF